MKRIICLISVICIALTACGKGGGKNDSDAANIQNVALDFTCTESFTDSGIVYQNDEGILHFFDVESGYDTALCSKANCKHNGVSLGNPKSDCDGYVEGLGASCEAIYGGKLYFLYTPESDDRGYAGFGIKRLCRADTDGTNRKIIAELDNAQMITGACYGEGYLAVAYKNTFDENGNSLPVMSAYVSVIDLETGNMTSQKIEGCETNIRKLCIENGKVYFDCTYLKSELKTDSFKNDEDMQDFINKNICCDIYEMSIDNGDMKKTYSSSGSCSDIGHGYAVVNKDSPVIIELSSGKTTELDEKYKDCIFNTLSEGILIYDYAGGEYSLYDTGKNELKSVLKKTQENYFNITAVTDKRVYVNYQKNDDFCLGVMDKDKLLSGEADIQFIKVI